MIIIILVILLVIIGLVVYFVLKNKTSSDQPPILPNYLKDKTNGYFLYNPSTNKLYYQYDGDKYLDAGYCGNCVAACQNGIEIQDVNVGINCNDPSNSDKCKGATGWILQQLYSADEFEQLIAKKVQGQKVLSTNDCIALVNANQPPPGTTGTNKLTPADEDQLEIMASALDSGYTNLRDFITKNKDQFEMLVTQIGMAKAIGLFSHTFASSAFIVPMFLQGQTFQASVFTVFEVTKEFNKWVLQTTTDYIANNIPKALSGDVADMTLEDTMNEVAGEIVVQTTAEIGERATAAVVAEAIQGVAEMLSDALAGAGFFQMMGMALDMLDPCGFNGTLYQSDIDSVSDAFDSAFYNKLLGQVGYIPVIFSADYVKEYGFQCSSSSTDNKNTLPESKDKIIQRLTSDPCDGYKAFLTKSKNDYLLSISNGINAYGQCTSSLSDEQFASFLNQLFGYSEGDKNYVTPEVIYQARVEFTDSKNFVAFFKKFFDTVELSIANNNTIVALYIQRYWYIVLSVIIIIILIVFLLK